MSLTSPLGLMRHVRRPDLRLEMVPWLNVLAVGGLLALLSSSYLYAPGIAVSLDSRRPSLPANLVLPDVPGGQLPGQRTVGVLTVLPHGKNPIFILKNGLHQLADLPQALKKFRDSLPANTGNPDLRNPVLLVKAGGELPYETILQVCDLAHAAGFELQLAGVEANPDATTTPAPSSPQASDSPPATAN